MISKKNLHATSSMKVDSHLNARSLRGIVLIRRLVPLPFEARTIATWCGLLLPTSLPSTVFRI